jgi:hypothetical protein
LNYSQDLFCVTFGAGGIPDVFDFAVDPDEEGAADGAGENAAHELLRAPHAVSFDHFVGGIAQQGKIQFLLGFEFGERSFRVGACSQDADIELVEVLFCVAKLGRFGGSTGSVGFGEKEDYHTVAGEVFE